MKKLILITGLLLCSNGWAEQSNPCHQYYPNIPGELLLENDKLVVQRFTIQPGQWEGIHRHPPDQLYIHIKGGEWTVKYGDGATTSYSPTGEIGWDDSATELSELHESGNTGDESIDLVWVTLKPGCLDGN
jgi:predicted metal-dependent enzyme (double-stranded beta helix superfamily)